MNQPKRVAITGAAGQIGYSILPRIAAGEIYGPEQPIILQCLEIAPAMKALEGVAMELDDCAFPLLEGIVCSDDPDVAFGDADLVIMVGAKPRGKGMERGDLIKTNGPIFVGQGEAIERSAASDVRVIVVGNPCNTNCLIAMHNAPKVAKDRWTAMTQLDHNRALAQLAGRASAQTRNVHNAIIWGNHSATQFPEWRHATINGKPASEVIHDREWFVDKFIPTVQKRGAAIIEARGQSSAMSAANAAIDHARSLFLGTDKDEWTSMAVCSDGSYDVPEGLIASFPVTCAGDGSWQIVQGLDFDDFGREKLAITVKELEAERDTVKDLLA